MATTLQTIITLARDRLNEPIARFWTDAELLRYANRGIRDLWRRLKMTNQDFFHQISVTVTQDINATQLSNVPTNVTQIHGIEPYDLQRFSCLYYKKLDYNHVDFITARASTAIEPINGSIIFYAPTQAGAPVAAPVILVAPKVSAQVTLRLTFTPTVGAELVVTDPNPIPGESDNAVHHWVVAYARGRERKDQQPDPKELELYEAEALKIGASETPRDDSEPEVVEAMFEDYW